MGDIRVQRSVRCSRRAPAPGHQRNASKVERVCELANKRSREQMIAEARQEGLESVIIDGEIVVLGHAPSAPSYEIRVSNDGWGGNYS